MNGSHPLLDIAACRARQVRLLATLAAAELDLAVVVTPEHIEYLTGHRWDHRFLPLAAVTSDGHCLLICPDKPAHEPAADDVRTYEAKWRSTLRNDQREAVAGVFADWVSGRRPQRVGVEFSACPPHVTAALGGAELVDVEPALLAMRRRKDPDELALLRRAIAACGAMYETARSIITPGINELEVFSALQAAAVARCGEMLTATGNDYACGVRGGPPRDRRCEAGELYILDLGPAYRGCSRSWNDSPVRGFAAGRSMRRFASGWQTLPSEPGRATSATASGCFPTRPRISTPPGTTRSRRGR